jgi:hypothetical protein
VPVLSIKHLAALRITSQAIQWFAACLGCKDVSWSS